jgi:hypothetical protein
VPRAGWIKPQDDQRLTDHIALGVLTRTFPPELVDAVLADTGRLEQRHRLLPARLVVYYVLAMALFSQAGYEEVMRSLVEGLAWQSGWRQTWSVPSQPAISQARSRLGEAPLAALFGQACVPIAKAGMPGAFYRHWRLVSIDGSTLDLADTPENEETFGRPGSGRGEAGVGAFPQLRLVALAECGTHAMFAAVFGPCSTGESTLARELTGSLGPGMLVLADRGFTAHPLFSAFSATGADLCWRAKDNAVLPVLERFADGSFASEIVASTDKRVRKDVIAVRVVEYALDDPGRPQTKDRYRLITTVMDPDAAPAGELAGVYAERWEFETALDELKTHQRGSRIVLRSKTPDGVRQEVWGYLCTHYAIRALMATAAAEQDLDPDRLSFTRSLHAARRSVRAGIGTTAVLIAVAVQTTVTEICGGLLPRRRLRSAARVVKRKMSKYGVKRDVHRSWPRPSRQPAEAVRVLAPP